jgi:hypothetical protein
MRYKNPLSGSDPMKLYDQLRKGFHRDGEPPIHVDNGLITLPIWEDAEMVMERARCDGIHPDLIIGSGHGRKKLVLWRESEVHPYATWHRKS